MEETLRCARRTLECGVLRSAFGVVERLASEWIRRQTIEETLRCARRTLEKKKLHRAC
jgi:hypothetical protein